MTPIPGWYPDPADPDTQRYWDGEQWLGAPLPVGATPPPGPPPPAPAPAPAPVPAAPSSPPDGPPSGPPAARSGWSPTWPGAGGPGAVPPAPPQEKPGLPGGEGKRGGRAGQPPMLPPVPPGHIRIPGTTTTMPIDTTKLAPLGLRVAARLIDVVAVFLLCVVVNGYFAVQYANEVGPDVRDIWLGEETLSAEATRLNWIILLLTIGLWFAYEVPATSNSGQTLGKRLVGIRVVRVIDDAPLTFGQSFRRWLILMLPSPVMSAFCGFPLQLADLLWCLWDRPARQCLHDKAVTSIVVRSAAVPIAPAPPADKPKS